MSPSRVSRRKFVQSITLASAAAVVPRLGAAAFRSHPVPSSPLSEPLGEFGYGDITLHSELHEQQLQQTFSVIMGLSNDAMLKPFRQMAGQAAPGDDLGGWYRFDPDDDANMFASGFAPGSTFGQWVSALSRLHAITGSPEARAKVLQLTKLYAQTIGGKFYDNTRFPAYTYDKLVCGLVDAHKFAGDPQAWAVLGRMTDTALQHLPPKAVEHGQPWRAAKDVSWNWDESYTMPENLFLAYQRGAGDRYRELGAQYLNDTFFDRLAAGQNDFAGRHAYSHVNALSSAMQAYLTLGSEKHLQAAKNGFDMVTAQSFATGGWGPDEQLRATGSPDVYDSLTKTHNSFETPCGSYGHFKLTRYLLRVTRDARYGDSMERVMYNTVLGAKPLKADGSTFYYSDYNLQGRKVYSTNHWPCCSGTLPQVAADYRINTYFHDASGVYVNLYVPSTLRWIKNDAQIELTQRGQYPLDSHVEFEVKTSRAAKFGVNLRIPAWAEGASFAVNGGRITAPAGTFARVEREWKNGDHIDLELPMTTRLEAIDPQHPNTVALMVGPLVLFGDQVPGVTRANLLAAKRMAQDLWHVSPDQNIVMKMVPWTVIEDQPYTTYLKIS